jgi:DNA-binding transcriptional MocR family regulator
MTNWLPLLDQTHSPVYRKIADALAADIAAGRLPPGMQLPTHRDLAWRLGVTVGTVSRAYSEAERRGLIGGEVGRGTFVLPARRDWTSAVAIGEPDGFVDLSRNYAVTGSEAPLLGETVASLAARADFGLLLHYQPHAGRREDRAAGAEWLRRTTLPQADANHTLVTHGGQHAIAVILAALTRPGDAVAVEQLTYPGFKAAAQQAGLQLVGLPIDDAGLQPEALDAACRARTIRLLYVLPTLHNPTLATMPQERRQEIAAVCRQHDLTVIEDDVYGFLYDPPRQPIVALLPERGYYISSLSKACAPGLRIGYIHAPGGIDRIATAIGASIYMAQPLMAAVASRWMADGTVDRLAAEKRRLAAARQAIVQTVFGSPPSGAKLVSDPASLHCWLILPAGWRAEEFAAAARQRGVGITPAAAFAVGAAAPEAVRFCLGTPETGEQLGRAVRALAATLSENPSPYLSVV